MIVRDTAAGHGMRHRGRLVPSAHLLSDLGGEAGTAELLAFAARVGLKEEWIQHRGQPKEHFDVFGSRIERVDRAGAKVLSRAAFVAILRRKRGDP